MAAHPSKRWKLAVRGKSSGSSASRHAADAFKSPSAAVPAFASSSSALPSSSDPPDAESSVPVLALDPHKIQHVLAVSQLEVSKLVNMSELLPSPLHQLRELSLSDKTSLHLTVAPPPTVPLLRHEKHTLDTEAMVLSLLRPSGLPVAQVLRHETTPKAIGAPFLLTTNLPGAQLSKVLVSRNAPAGQRRDAIQEQLQRLLNSISAHVAITFGPVPTVAGGKGHETWGAAFRAMFGDTIKDAEDGFVHLPYGQIGTAVDQALVALDDVQEARLVVPGLTKPGSVLVEPMDDGYWRITGLTGFQGAFWGDPALGKIIEGLPPGPASESSRLNPLMFVKDRHRQKLLLYTMYKSILAITMACYRPNSSGSQEIGARRELISCLDKLRSFQQ